MFEKIKERLKGEFSSESPITDKNCKCRNEYVYLGQNLIMCKNCHRTFEFRKFLGEIKLNKITLDKILSKRGLQNNDKVKIE